jgi:glyoxylase-like metal-dependent hydrolase (beta-lactamase superfamily II)
LSLPGAQRLDVPGYVDIGEQTLEVHPADGHTVDGMAVWIPWARVLVAGDYLSPVEIPMLSPGGSVAAYLATLNRLEPLVSEAEWVVPGHGGPIDGTVYAPLVEEDAVATAVVEQDGLAFTAHDQGVAAGDGDVLELDIGADAAADAGDAVSDDDDAIIEVKGRFHVLEGRGWG